MRDRPTTPGRLAPGRSEMVAAIDQWRSVAGPYAALFDLLPLPVSVSQLPEAVFVDVNRAFVETFDLPREEILGRTSVEIGIDLGAEARERIQRELQEHGQVSNIEVPLTLRGRGARVLRVDVRHFEVRGQRYSVQMTFDVTEQRRNQAALVDSEEQLRTAQKLEAVGRLAGGVAHDFNNMLSVVLANADFGLEAVRKGDPLYVDLTEIRGAAERAAGLTRQLLAFSRRQILEPEVLSLNHVIKGIEGMLRRLIGEDIAVTLDLAKELANVRADPGQIEQVIMNLAVNARDAMPRGGRLVLATTNTDVDPAWGATHGLPPGRFVVMSVRDTGVGMDAATRQRIFEPFFTTKEKGKGTGLGLSTVYGIVTQSGGHIRVESEPGRGATFRIYLPLVEAAVEEARRRPEPARARGQETVLVVEDEEVVRRVIERILKKAGYEVMTAASGGDALLLCERHPGSIDLLLTDVVMPQMSGRELAERLAQVRKGLRVLFMSGYTDDAIVHHGVQQSPGHFVGKPFAASELTAKVRTVLDEPASV